MTVAVSTHCPTGHLTALPACLLARPPACLLLLLHGAGSFSVRPALCWALWVVCWASQGWVLASSGMAATWQAALHEAPTGPGEHSSQDPCLGGISLCLDNIPLLSVWKAAFVNHDSRSHYQQPLAFECTAPSHTHLTCGCLKSTYTGT